MRTGTTKNSRLFEGSNNNILPVEMLQNKDLMITPPQVVIQKASNLESKLLSLKAELQIHLIYDTSLSDKENSKNTTFVSALNQCGEARDNQSKSVIETFGGCALNSCVYITVGATV